MGGLSIGLCLIWGTPFVAGCCALCPCCSWLCCYTYVPPCPLCSAPRDALLSVEQALAQATAAAEKAKSQSRSSKGGALGSGGDAGATRPLSLKERLAQHAQEAAQQQAALEAASAEEDRKEASSSSMGVGLRRVMMMRRY